MKVSEGSKTVFLNRAKIGLRLQDGLNFSIISCKAKTMTLDIFQFSTGIKGRYTNFLYQLTQMWSQREKERGTLAVISMSRTI